MQRLLVVSLLCLGLAPAARGEVGIQIESPLCFSNALPLAQEFTFQIKAQDFGGNGFERLEFRISGFSIENLVVVTEILPNTLAISAAGNPFEEGAIITFDGCQQSQDPILLYTVTALSFQPNYQPVIELQGMTAPSDPSFDCPTATACDGSETCLSDWIYTQQISAPPRAPYPPNDATDVAPDVVLGFDYDWVCGCLGLPCYSLDFGTEPDPPHFSGVCDGPLPQPGMLEPFTAYYWRVTVNLCGTATSPVWSFTTGAPLSLDSVDWSTVKQLYR